MSAEPSWIAAARAFDAEDLLGLHQAALDTPESFSWPTATKRRGRPKGTLGSTARAIRCAVHELTDQYDRMTVRQVFYQLETAGIVAKTDGGYRQVQQQLVKMRREEALSWDFITDGTRWQRKPDSYADAGDYIEEMARGYRRDLWQSQNVRIEIWLEKDALADVIVDATDAWDVSLMVSRGQSSVTFLHAAAMAAEAAHAETGVCTYIYALYDFDAGGERAYRTIATELPEYAPDTPIVVSRLAVTPEQIVEWNLRSTSAKGSNPSYRYGRNDERPSP